MQQRGTDTLSHHADAGVSTSETRLADEQEGNAAVNTDGSVSVAQFMGMQLPAVGVRWSQQERDRAKRASDLINEARRDLDWDQLRNCWIAIRLSDGSSDMVIYDCKRDAVQRQLHEQQCAYIAFKNLIAGATEREMLRVLRFIESAYNAGMRLPDPDDAFGGPDLAPRAADIDAITGRRRTVRHG